MVEEISLFDLNEIDEIEQKAIEKEPKRTIRDLQGVLWEIYKSMIVRYRNEATISKECVFWRVQELSKHGDFNKNRLDYKIDYRKIDTLDSIEKKLDELIAIQKQGKFYNCSSDTLKKWIKEMR